MKTIKTISLLTLTVVLILTNCQKDKIIHNCKEQKGHVCVYYDVEKCEASPQKTDDEILQNKIDYLDQKGIELTNVYIDDNGEQQLCKACSCKSGKRIYGNVKEGDLGLIIEEGFEIL